MNKEPLVIGTNSKNTLPLPPFSLKHVLFQQAVFSELQCLGTGTGSLSGLSLLSPGDIEVKADLLEVKAELLINSQFSKFLKQLLIVRNYRII